MGLVAMIGDHPGNMIGFTASCCFLGGFKSRGFDKELNFLMESIASIAPNGLTILLPGLIFKKEKSVFRGALMAWGEVAKKVVAREIWLERMLQYAKTAPPHSVVWLEQGIFYYLDDFEVIMPPFTVESSELSESYKDSSDLIGMTRAQKTYDQLLREPWRLTPEDYSYREDPDFVLR